MVTRKNGEAVVVVSVVVMSLDAWNAINETLYLLSSPRNASGLRSAIEQLDGGLGSERILIE